MKNKRNLSLYIHVPFCVQKCRYCDFYSAAAGAEEKRAYTALLCREIKSWGELLRKDYKLYTVFLGGGTPSCLAPECLVRIGQTIRESFECSDLIEYTTEANPGTVTKEHLTAWQQMGINRVSLGLQSAVNEELSMLGRIHTYEQFLETYHQVRESGIDNINVDVMAAIPGQTMESYQKTLRRIVKLQPEHISSYSLIVEPGTVFGDWEENGTLNCPNEETDRAMYQWTKRFLDENGYHRYEVSNYAHKDMECVHNCVYWTGGEYLGVGVNASSYLGGYRFQVPLQAKQYEAYIKKLEESVSIHAVNKDGILECMQDVEKVERTAQMEEFMFLGLRMIQGISKQEFSNRFGVDIMSVYGPVIQRYEQEHLLEQTAEGYLCLTEHGIDVSNQILADFLIDTES